MNKRIILLTVMAALLVWGCGKGPKQETTQRPTTRTETPPTTDTGTPDRPDDRTVMSEALRQLRTIYFDFDKYNLRDDARRDLDRNAEILKQYPSASIIIEGHCDERGTNEYNLALGERRARAARDYLVRSGVDASRLSVISYGEERPVALGHDEASWAQNRRAEFVPR